MKFYIAAAYSDPTQLNEIARTAESAGFGGIVVSDHLIYPEKLATPYPYRRTGKPRWEIDTPWPDPLIAAASMAAVTEHLRFLTGVYVLPLRPPVLAAKVIATTSVMSGGRLTLGIGAGWMREEFAAAGQPFRGRGSRLDESLEVMRKLWQGGIVEHKGEHFEFEPLQMTPVPKEPIPIYAGGLSDVALRRAATQCDGWVSEMQTLEKVREVAAKLRALRTESERAGEPFGMCCAFKDVYDLDGYRRVADLGVTEFTTVPWYFYGGDLGSCSVKCDGIKRFGDDVIAKL